MASGDRLSTHMTGTAGPTLLGLAAERIARPDGTLEPGVVWVDPTTGTIVDVVRQEAGPAGTRPEDVPGRIVDFGDGIVAPGFVDLHVHGGGGSQVNDDAMDAVASSVESMAAFHARHGTTSLLATTVSDSPERLLASVKGIAQVATGPTTSGARVLGAHLEGPFLSPLRAGAQDPACIRLPDRRELRGLLDACGGTIRIVTLAPERAGAEGLITDCIEAGVVIALGHTDAGYDETRRAFDAGVSHVVHLFDAMRPFHHRDPGPVAAAILDGGVTVELICDLHHVDAAAVELVFCVAPGRTVLVTDATAASGVGPGRHRLGELDVEVDGTRVSLASDATTLAGSVLTMGRAVRNSVEAGHVHLGDALAAASAVPARAARLTALPGLGNLGKVTPGAPADLVILDPSFEVVATLVAGKAVHDPAARFG